MSSALSNPAKSQSEIRAQLKEITDPWEKSAQARGRPNANIHNDGEAIHQYFAVQPLHKWLNQAANKGNPVARFPRAFVDNIVYTRGRDLSLLREIEGDVDYDAYTPEVSHPALEDIPRYRAKIFEWIADEEYRVNGVRSVKGTDMFIHGEPGGGKSTLALSTAMWRMQVNNETYIWAETVDESGTNERTEWLSMAPFATVCIPAGMDERVRIVPEDTTVPPFEVDIEDICRDVIRYRSVQDLTERLVPGGFHVVFPDPLHRGCEDVSKFRYWSYDELHKEDAPDRPTDTDQWWFAFISHRISGDVFTHPTFINIDETGNLLDADAEKDEHEHYQKIKHYREKYADARKKGVSFAYQAHSLSEVHYMARQKIRWRVTMAGNAPPIGRKLPGGRRCPLNTDVTSHLPPGRAVIWKSPHFAEIAWPDLKGKIRLDAEVSIDFLEWSETVGGSR